MSDIAFNKVYCGLHNYSSIQAFIQNQFSDPTINYISPVYTTVLSSIYVLYYLSMYILKRSSHYDVLILITSLGRFSLLSYSNFFKIGLGGAKVSIFFFFRFVRTLYFLFLGWKQEVFNWAWEDEWKSFMSGVPNSKLQLRKFNKNRFHRNSTAFLTIFFFFNLYWIYFYINFTIN